METIGLLKPVLFFYSQEQDASTMGDRRLVFVEENGHLTVRDRAGNRLARFETVGFYTRTGLEGRLALFTGVRFFYEGESGDGDHRIYKAITGFVSCSYYSVAIGTGVEVEVVTTSKVVSPEDLEAGVFYPCVSVWM